MKNNRSTNSVNYIFALAIGFVAIIIILTVFNFSIGSNDFSLLLQTLAQ